MTQKTCITWQTYDFYFSNLLLLDLDFDRFRITFVFMQYLSHAYASTLGDSEHFAARLTSPRAQKVKTLYFQFWPDIGLTTDINIKL